MKMNAKNSVVMVGGVVGLFALYKIFTVLNAANKGIDSTTKSVAQWWVNLDGGIEQSDFFVGRLWRDNFGGDWQIKPDVYEVYNSAYPSEINQILTPDLILKEEYRNEVSG